MIRCRRIKCVWLIYTRVWSPDVLSKFALERSLCLYTHFCFQISFPKLLNFKIIKCALKKNVLGVRSIIRHTKQIECNLYRIGEIIFRSTGWWKLIESALSPGDPSPKSQFFTSVKISRFMKKIKQQSTATVLQNKEAGPETDIYWQRGASNPASNGRLRLVLLKSHYKYLGYKCQSVVSILCTSIEYFHIQSCFGLSLWLWGTKHIHCHIQKIRSCISLPHSTCIHQVSSPIIKSDEIMKVKLSQIINLEKSNDKLILTFISLMPHCYWFSDMWVSSQCCFATNKIRNLRVAPYFTHKW